MIEFFLLIIVVVVNVKCGSNKELKVSWTWKELLIKESKQLEIIENRCCGQFFRHSKTTNDNLNYILSYGGIMMKKNEKLWQIGNDIWGFGVMNHMWTHISEIENGEQLCYYSIIEMNEEKTLIFFNQSLPITYGQYKTAIVFIGGIKSMYYVEKTLGYYPKELNEKISVYFPDENKFYHMFNHKNLSRHSTAIQWFNNSIYIFGGSRDVAKFDENNKLFEKNVNSNYALNDLLVYDVVRRELKTINDNNEEGKRFSTERGKFHENNQPTPRRGFVHWIERTDKWYFFGGYNDKEKDLNDMWVLDLNILQWSFLSEPSYDSIFPRSYSTVFKLNDSIHCIFSGKRKIDNYLEILDGETIENGEFCYDSIQNKWLTFVKETSYEYVVDGRLFYSYPEKSSSIFSSSNIPDGVHSTYFYQHESFFIFYGGKKGKELSDSMWFQKFYQCNTICTDGGYCYYEDNSTIKCVCKYGYDGEFCEENQFGKNFLWRFVVVDVLTFVMFILLMIPCLICCICSINSRKAKKLVLSKESNQSSSEVVEIKSKNEEDEVIKKEDEINTQKEVDKENVELQNKIIIVNNDSELLSKVEVKTTEIDTKTDQTKGPTKDVTFYDKFIGLFSTFKKIEKKNGKTYKLYFQFLLLSSVVNFVLFLIHSILYFVDVSLKSKRYSVSYISAPTFWQLFSSGSFEVDLYNYWLGVNIFSYLFYFCFVVTWFIYVFFFVQKEDKKSEKMEKGKSKLLWLRVTINVIVFLVVLLVAIILLSFMRILITYSTGVSDYYFAQQDVYFTVYFSIFSFCYGVVISIVISLFELFFNWLTKMEKLKLKMNDRISSLLKVGTFKILVIFSANIIVFAIPYSCVIDSIGIAALSQLFSEIFIGSLNELIFFFLPGKKIFLWFCSGIYSCIGNYWADKKQEETEEKMKLVKPTFDLESEYYQVIGYQFVTLFAMSCAPFLLGITSILFIVQVIIDLIKMKYHEKKNTKNEIEYIPLRYYKGLVFIIMFLWIMSVIAFSFHFWKYPVLRWIESWKIVVVQYPETCNLLK